MTLDQPVGGSGGGLLIGCVRHPWGVTESPILTWLVGVGVGDRAVGAFGDDDGGESRGAVRNLLLRPHSSGDLTGPGNYPDGCVDAFDLGALLAAWCSVAGGNPCGTCFGP